jgi:LemA protein
VGLYITGAILILLIIGVILIYNGLVQKSQMADNGWSDIDVQLKRRANLIPQLVNTVQGYATHERELFADIAEKRAKALAAGDDLASRGEAESELSRPVAKADGRGRRLSRHEGQPELPRPAAGAGGH